jgi:hypothetical protein
LILRTSTLLTMLSMAQMACEHKPDHMSPLQALCSPSLHPTSRQKARNLGQLDILPARLTSMLNWCLYTHHWFAASLAGCTAGVVGSCLLQKQPVV